MDADDPRSASKKRALAATVARTPSPSRRRRRRLLTGSSPGCVPRPATAPSASSTTPTRSVFRTPPPRRLLPPSTTASATRRAGMTPPPRLPRSATPVLRLDDVEMDDGDDALSIISGDGSPERDRHVLDFLSFGDGTPAFTLFTPSPAAPKTAVTRSIKAELTSGFLTPHASPSRASKDVSPSHFFRSPYSKSRSNSVTSSPARLRLSHDEHDEEEHELERRRSVTRSPRTPQRVSIKHEPMPDAIICKVPEGTRSSSSTPLTTWRRNSLSLMRTPSPAASAKAKALRVRAKLLRSTGRDPFASDDDYLSSAPSALQGTNDQDWLFSFANTLSPLAPGGANDEDLETSFFSLRFSPTSSSAIDLQRLLPPFPSPGLAPQEPPAQPAPTPKTPVPATESKSSSSASSSSATPSSSASSRTSSSSSSASRDLTESFPNIRASTSATPGRDERLKVSSSSVMKMKLHVTFDQFPPSHTKREMEAINNSLKRKKQARKRKLEESKHRQLKTNSKGLNVQRKLLQTPVKEDEAAPGESKVEEESENVRPKPKPKHSKNRQALQWLSGRSAQRKLLDTDEDENKESTVQKIPTVAEKAEAESTENAKLPNAESPASTLRRRLSPTLGSVSTPTLPSTLTTAVQKPNLHPLKLRKSPLPAKCQDALTVAVPKTAEKIPTSLSSTVQKVPTAVPVKDVVSTGTTPSQQKPQSKPQQPKPLSIPSLPVPTATPAKTPVIKLEQPASATPLPVSTSGFVASSRLLATPVQQPAPTVTPGAVPSSTTPGAGDASKKVHCNCKKSKCLKLYCECFANGEYCDDLCNCVGCCNTHTHEEVRQQAITSRLEKNPNAFKPKIELTVVTMTPSGVTPAKSFLTPHGHQHRQHQHHAHVHGKGDVSGDLKKMHKHGCHCKKSGCQKRYCECFQAGVPCGENCRCIDCKNHSPHSTKLAGVATPLSAVAVRGPGPRELGRGAVAIAAAATPDANGKQFVSPTMQSVRQQLRIDRETWARNFSSPFEVSPRRERERTERLRAQLKNSRASALQRSFNTTAAPTTQAGTSAVVIKTESGAVASTQATLSFRVNTTASFTSPPGVTVARGRVQPPRSLSPLSDATRPPPAPTPFGKDARSRHTKRFVPYNPHALEALAIGRKTKGRVYVLPLFGDDLPPVKTDVSAKIFHFLTNADVYNASLVNRLWSRVTMGDTVWDHHNFRRMPSHLLAADASHQPDDGDVAMQG